MSNADWQFHPAADHGLGPVERLRSTRREQGLLSWAMHHLALAGLRTTLKVYHRFEVHGRENLPTAPPFVMIANHASHLDALVLAAALPRKVSATTFPVAAGDVFFESAALSAATALFINALPLWRKRATGHALEDLRARLLGRREGAPGSSVLGPEQGSRRDVQDSGLQDSGPKGSTRDIAHQPECFSPVGLILFPEGARSRDGAMMPFKPGIGRIVAATSVPVIPCWIDGAHGAFPPGTWLPRPRKLVVRVGAPLKFADQPESRDGYDAVATRLHQAVEALRADTQRVGG
ncbi:MAG: 1-acyl-sn-glycerol-3-phosphate acyltransferase [Phycisphaeraceae bacterium]|nr:1-acyl-sn-glycerol-3-phosphate acyltransferase [Phycisphaeraceae bacterium]